MSDVSQSRAVLQDDGTSIVLHAYDRADGPPTVVRLTVLAAMRLAEQLAGAAARHLAAERNHAAGVRRGNP